MNIILFTGTILLAETILQTGALLQTGTILLVETMLPVGAILSPGIIQLTETILQAGISTSEAGSSFSAFMYSHNLIFVVLGVSLIIWLLLAVYLIRLDKKLSRLEKKR